MQGKGKLERRQHEVLAAIVRRYVSTGVPVGSKAIAEESAEGVSPATIRSIMAELEAEGFLAQPHISAGRVPTDLAYRFYVDQLAGVAGLGAATEHYIHASLGATAASPEEFMGAISHILSEVSRNVGVVLAPALEEKLLDHVKFVALPDRRVLAVIVSRPDLIENHVIRLDDEMSQAELDHAAEYLNVEFRGWSLRTIRLEIFKRMEEMKAVCDSLVTRVATLFVEGALGRDESGSLFVDGTEKILDQPEFAEIRKVRELLVTFEEKAKLVKILTGCLESPGRGLRILIGRENSEAEMHPFTLILAPYLYRNRAVGALGVMGPTRMEYERAITAVEYVAQLTSRLLSAN
ncbi:MAG TPA: heat-inducible transcriptional repressor HrcA [Terriglobia bacterium]|nr:heat-inducible transcriptional repressor HrcA [Terriglobia bacterium]